MACGILEPLPGIEPVPPKSLSVVSDSLRLHGLLQARILEWVAFSLLQGIFPTHGSNPGLSHCRQILYQLSHKGSPKCPKVIF